MYSIGQRVRLTKVDKTDKERGYKVGDIITITKICGGLSAPIFNDKEHSFFLDQLAPVFEIGDTVECIETDGLYAFISQGEEYTISEISLCGNLKFKEIENLTPCWYKKELFKLIRKGAGMAKSLRDRIEALTGWDKEADDVLNKLYDKTDLRFWVDSYGETGCIVIVGHGTCLDVIAKEGCQKQKYEKHFNFVSQCSKLRAFKDALLFLLDKSGLEKKDTEKEELLKQIAELRTHHEQEGQRIEELERKVGK